MLYHPAPTTLTTLQASYPGSIDRAESNENTPLVSSIDDGSVSYTGLQSPLIQSTEVPELEGGTGRYTPVQNTFNDAEDLKPKGVWQLPHKDYDVSVSWRG